MGIADPFPTLTKRHRLYEALSARQKRDGVGNLAVAFIHEAMNPVLYTGRSEDFGWRRDNLNEVLAFCGYVLGENGKLQHRPPVQTLEEAEQRASSLRAELRRRNVHPDVLKFCRAELLQKNYFHAVFEATKSVAEKIRQRTGLTADGSPLVEQAFSFRNEIPFLALNRLYTETEQSEQVGLMFMMKGIFGTFRNVTAHAPKISWDIGEQDALDLLNIVSFLHRRLDSAIRTPRENPLSA